MFESLQDKFGTLFRNLAGKGKISETNVRDAMKEVRTALRRGLNPRWEGHDPDWLTRRTGLVHGAA